MWLCSRHDTPERHAHTSAVFREAGVLDPDPSRERDSADDIEILAGLEEDINEAEGMVGMDEGGSGRSRGDSGMDSGSGSPLGSPLQPASTSLQATRQLPGVVHAHFLRLSEPTETAAVLRLFLTFVSTGHLPIPDDGTTLDALETLRALVLFLRKYECEPTLSLFLTVLREAVRQPSSVSPLAAFVAGASAGDAFTCSVALDVTDWTWRMMDRHDLPAAPDANVFDPHHMPVAVWQLIPPMYTWALTTAWTGADEGRGGRVAGGGGGGGVVGGGRGGRVGGGRGGGGGGLGRGGGGGGEGEEGEQDGLSGLRHGAAFVRRMAVGEFQPDPEEPDLGLELELD